MTTTKDTEKWETHAHLGVSSSVVLQAAILGQVFGMMLGVCEMILRYLAQTVQHELNVSNAVSGLGI